MGLLHKSQAQFARAQWRIRLLAPIWASQLLLTMTMMGLFAWRFGDTMRHHGDKVEAGKTPMIEYAWEVTNIVMSLVASLCTFVDVFRYYTESLTPWTMLFTHVIKATCAFAILALDVAVYIVLSEEKYSLIGIALDSLLILLTGAMAMYAFLAYRRLSAYDDYAHPANVKGYGFNDSVSNASYLSASKRRVSSSAAAVDMDVLDGSSTTPYDHQRDTQFDDYMAKRNSFNGHLRRENSTSSGARSPPEGPLLLLSPPQSLSPSPPLAAAGHVVKSLKRAPSAPRAISWASDHVLVAVPEEEDDELAAGNTNTDEVSLLSPDSSEVAGCDGPRVAQETDIPEPKWK
ncbi:hypothetical protein A9K55_003479 [Cordyceps militaris]|uniref:Uncharacterized protein n=1 Tax=Cordyceps militaris TaxID=73501 RepID=A0A2H4S788_CORMI|nr:hypothetical protein A9K55_003479 [Cordyceps militaris]